MSRSLEDARACLAEEIWARVAAGKSTLMLSIDVAATEDGKGAVIYLELDDGSILHAGFDFGGTRINPSDFNGSLYTEQLLVTEQAIG